MIAYSYIEKNLQELDKRYRRSRGIKDANFTSKLATLELCGWIEESMDDCILRASVRVLRQNDNRNFIKEKVKRTYGFEYERHFKTMMINLVGVSGFEKINQSIDPAVEARFKAALNSLKSMRNSLAHTYTKGITQPYHAPSVAIELQLDVKAGLKAYDSALRKFCPQS